MKIRFHPYLNYHAERCLGLREINFTILPEANLFIAQFDYSLSMARGAYIYRYKHFHRATPLRESLRIILHEFSKLIMNMKTLCQLQKILKNNIKSSMFWPRSSHPIELIFMSPQPHRCYM